MKGKKNIEELGENNRVKKKLKVLSV